MPIGLIFVAAVLLFAVFRALKTHFVCPECGASFKVNILKYIFTSHYMGKRMARCPYCNHCELLEPKWDEKKL